MPIYLQIGNVFLFNGGGAWTLFAHSYRGRALGAKRHPPKITFQCNIQSVINILPRLLHENNSSDSPLFLRLSICSKTT